MSSASLAPEIAAGSLKSNENGVTHAVMTKGPSLSYSTRAVTALTENGSSDAQDESITLSGEMQAISSASNTEDSGLQAIGKPPTPPPKFTQHSQDQTVLNRSETTNPVGTSENVHSLEVDKLISVSATRHKRKSVANEQQPDVDVGNPDEEATRSNAQIQTSTVAGPPLDERVGQARSSAPLQQVNISDSTTIVNQVRLTSQIINGQSQQPVQLGDPAALRQTPIVEGIPVIKGVPAGDKAPATIAPSTAESVNQSQVSLVQTIIAPQGATVVGMVGTTPIVRLPEISKSVVTKKRGRFKVFQPVIDVAPVDSIASTLPVSTETPAGMILDNDLSVFLAGAQDVTVETGLIGATQSNQSSLPLSNQEKPQTFEGTGDPVVKRKGRFFVTNLKDPGLIAMQVVNGVSTSMMPDTHGTVESYQVTSSTYVQGNSPSVFVAPDMPDSQSMIMTAPSASNFSATSSIVPMLQQNQTQQRVQYDHLAVPQDHPGVLVQETHCRDHNVRYAAESQHSVFSHATNNVHSEAEPKVSGAVERADSAADRLRDQPEASQNSKEKAGGYQPVTKSARDEHVAPSGLGKVFHFLDQMRTEVAQADKMIKTLQADTRLLKEKNKELEAKAMDSERRFREEKALREAAEAKLKALRKKVRSMREGSDVKKESDFTLASTTQPEDTEPGHTQASEGAMERSSVHSTDNHGTKSPEHGQTHRGNVESHSVPATPDATKKTKSTSLENLSVLNPVDKALQPTTPARRKGSSSSNVPVPKPSPGHRSVKSTPHIPSPTGFFNNAFSNQMQSRTFDGSPIQTTHVLQMTGSAQKDAGAQRYASTNFDPLAPEKSFTLDQDTIAPSDKSQNNFDPFSTAAPPIQFRGTRLQHNQVAATHVMHPAALFALNQNNMTVPVYGLPGTSFERLDPMAIQNQPMMQAFDPSQMPTPSSSVYEIQQITRQKLQRSVLPATQQTFEVHVESQLPPNQLTLGSGNNTVAEQNISASEQWSQQMSDAAPALSSVSKPTMSSDPFDELLNRVSQS